MLYWFIVDISRLFHLPNHLLACVTEGGSPMKKGFAAVLLALILSYIIITPALASATETPPPTPAPTTVPDSEDPGTQYQYMLFQNDPEPG